jgi:hypothetical protein
VGYNNAILIDTQPLAYVQFRVLIVGNDPPRGSGERKATPTEDVHCLPIPLIWKMQRVKIMHHPNHWVLGQAFIVVVECASVDAYNVGQQTDYIAREGAPFRHPRSCFRIIGSSDNSAVRRAQQISQRALPDQPTSEGGQTLGYRVTL